MMEENRKDDLKYWLIFGLIISLGIFLRFFLIGERPFHHDESLNAIYGRYFYSHPDTHYYKYDPMLHGPFLYNLSPFFYQILGASKSSARILMGLFGSFILFVPFLLRHKISKSILLLCTLFIATSPTLVYWSRFVRHDPPVIICLTMLLLGWVEKNSWKKSFLWTWGLILPFTMKENAYVHLAIFSGYLIYEWFISLFLKIETQTLISKLYQFLKRNRWKVLAGITTAALIYVFLFSAGFRYNEGILDGIYRKSLTYWISQHHKDRIAGPFIYQFLVLSWYEQVFLLLFLAQSFHFYLKRNFQVRGSILVFVLLGFIFRFLSPDKIPDSSFMNTFLKLKISLDFYPFFLLLGHALILTTTFILERKQSLAVTGYLFISFFFTYSLLGEKVPWLSQYPLLAGILFLTLYYQREMKPFKLKSGLLVLTSVLFLFQLRISLMTNFSRAGADTEFISQVHTTDHYEKMAFKIKNEIQFPLGKRPHVMAMEHNTWPLTWYLYGLDNYHYIKGKREIEEFDYILTSTTDYKTEKQLAETHQRTNIPLRWWWVPDYTKMTLKNYIGYALNHNPWTPTGKMDISLYSKKVME